MTKDILKIIKKIFTGQFKNKNRILKQIVWGFYYLYVIYFQQICIDRLKNILFKKQTFFNTEK